ncbi:2-isopropylmalate synthase [Methanosphaera sp. Vir-13MRS]|uniref:2-isopropylmalate synthase n=1 Tax=Candidatus Methanosphaera massiliense TaxID=3017187 RepID=UPI0023806455|nr:2-isopropylmalate synthase [Candidatus Methanosphaera massiliense]MDD6285575.1 2-isopropylmalate synthase [Methanobacteriaceae archaeon]MDE4078166.1 2-isopropylmalate synthase [Candidatus Methanosphaera massiliense]
MTYNPPSDVMIYDTTLRDGEQTPGVTITTDEKITIAEKLDKLGVDVIELGFPAASKGEQETFREASKLGLSAQLSGLARALTKDIDKAIDSDADYIHTFIGTSPLHRDYKLKMSKQEILDKAVTAVEYIKDHGIVAEFSCEDATRTELDYLLEVYEAVQEAGVDKINVPDTVGVSIPVKMNELISNLREKINVPISVHCHNDFGLAVANTLASVEAGAQQAQCTINGLGERAGNASLEEIVMGLHKFYKINTNINTKLLVNTSETVSRITGVKMPPNKAIVGENAFAHEAGIHVQGVLANSETYEPMKPEEVGHKRRIVLGKLTGANAVKSKLDEYNIKLNDEQFDQLYSQIKALGDKGKTITDMDFRSIAEAIQGKPTEERIKLIGINVMTGDNTVPTATVKLDIDGEVSYCAKTGVGPIDAAVNAIQELVKQVVNLELVEYHIEAVTGGTTAFGEVFVITADELGNKATGRASDEDIVKSSIDAVLSSANKLLMLRN